MSLSHQDTRHERYRLGLGSTGSGMDARTAALRGNVVHSLQSFPQMPSGRTDRGGAHSHAIALFITSRFPSPVGAVHCRPPTFSEGPSAPYPRGGSSFRETCGETRPCANGIVRVLGNQGAGITPCTEEEPW